jgi:hypothetical protein
MAAAVVTMGVAVVQSFDKCSSLGASLGGPGFCRCGHRWSGLRRLPFNTTSHLITTDFELSRIIIEVVTLQS